MIRIKIDLQDVDEHKLITHLEMIQWDIAGGATKGYGWEIIKDNPDEVKP